MNEQGHRATPNERSGINATSESYNHADALDAKLGPFRSVCYDAGPMGAYVDTNGVCLPDAGLEVPFAKLFVSACDLLARGLGGGLPSRAMRFPVKGWFASAANEIAGSPKRIRPSGERIRGQGSVRP